MLNLYKMPSFTFPKGFLWGSATAGHQIEGNNIHSQKWHDEITSRDPAYEHSGRACGSWDLYMDDIRLLKELGHQAYRFSLEWSRVEPEEGHFCTEAMTHYLKELEALKNAGLHCCVTLWHVTHPQWFEEKGGFRKEENLSCFQKYLQYLLPQIAPFCDSFCVMNEINLGFLPEIIASKKIKLKAHALGAQIIREHSKAPVSTAHAYVPRVPLRPYDEMDIAAAAYQEWCDNEFFFHAIRTGEIVLPGYDMEYIPELKDSCDFWALNYYHRRQIDSRKKDQVARKLDFNNYRMITSLPMDREFCPETFVNAMAKVTDKPVWITENGVCADADEFRIIYMMEQFQAMREAMELYHADIRAYFHWSLMDNYEWNSFKPRFGLASVDPITLKRTPKPSAYFLRDVIEQNGVSGELFAKYLPELPRYPLHDFDEHSFRTAAETQI